MNFLARTNKTATGFTMVEVLVSVVIFSIGLLGLAKLQITGLKDSQTTSARLLANQFVYEMADRLAANPAGTVTAANYIIAHGASAATPADCVSNPCTAAQIATLDIAQFKAGVAALPSGDAEISFADPNFSIVVRWDEDSNGSTGTNCPPQSDADLNCVRLQVTR